MEEFSYVLDYLWKVPSFIDSERDVETEKLEAYFPGDDPISHQLRTARWSREQHKLSSVFPRHMALGGLFASAALYEHFCLVFSKELELESGIRLETVRGNGVQRLHNYLKLTGVDFDTADYHRQVTALLTIRNCLYHANGDLSLSRDRDKLARIIRDQSYLSEGSRRALRALGELPDHVAIVGCPEAPQLRISNHYAFVGTSYLRDNFASMYMRRTNPGWVNFDRFPPGSPGHGHPGK